MKSHKPLLSSIIAVGFAVASLSSSATAADSPAELASEAKVSKHDAEKTALAKVPGGKIKTAELEKEHGKLVWSFDITTPKSPNITEVQVDAINGKVISTEIETPADQAKEAAADKKKKKN